MKTLLLLRHAKSSWDHPSLKDFDRPLNDRGTKAAPKMGAFMRRRKLKPDIILSSPAIRAKETIELVSESAGFPHIDFEPAIYEATAERLLQIISRLDDQAKTAMLVGHNPGFDDLLAALTGDHRHLSTAALACLEFDVATWRDVVCASGKLVWLARPKDLK